MDSRFRPPRASAKNATGGEWLRYAAILFSALSLCARLPDLLFQTTVAALMLPVAGAIAVRSIELYYVLPAIVAIAALTMRPKWWLVFPAMLLNAAVALLAVALPAILGEEFLRPAAEGVSSMSYFAALYVGLVILPTITSAFALYRRLLS